MPKPVRGSLQTALMVRLRASGHVSCGFFGPRWAFQRSTSSGCSVVLATHTAGAVSVDGYTLTLAVNPWNIVRRQLDPKPRAPLRLPLPARRPPTLWCTCPGRQRLLQGRPRRSGFLRLGASGPSPRLASAGVRKPSSKIPLKGVCCKDCGLGSSRTARSRPR